MSPSTEPATKEQLRHVRAFLNHNEALLKKSPSEWPVTHTVLQLASQETGEVFADPHSALGDETGGTILARIQKIEARIQLS